MEAGAGRGGSGREHSLPAGESSGAGDEHDDDFV